MNIITQAGIPCDAISGTVDQYYSRIGIVRTGIITQGIIVGIGIKEDAGNISRAGIPGEGAGGIADQIYSITLAGARAGVPGEGVIIGTGRQIYSYRRITRAGIPREFAGGTTVQIYSKT